MTMDASAFPCVVATGDQELSVWLSRAPTACFIFQRGLAEAKFGRQVRKPPSTAQS